MKTAKLELFAKTYYLREGSRWCMFSLAVKTGKREFKQIHGWESCREVLCNYAQSAFGDGGIYVADPTQKRIRDMSKISLSIMIRSPQRETEAKRKKDRKVVLAWIRRSLNLMRLCERETGIEKTRVYAANRWAVESNNAHFFVFEGSREWLAALPLLSLYALIIRAGRFRELSGPMESFEDLWKSLEKMAKEYKRIRKSVAMSSPVYRGGWPFKSRSVEMSKLRAKTFIFSRLEPLMLERKNIFLTPKENYIETTRMQHGVAGITGYAGSSFPRGWMKENFKNAKKKYRRKNLLK